MPLKELIIKQKAVKKTHKKKKIEVKTHKRKSYNSEFDAVTIFIKRSHIYVYIHTRHHIMSHGSLSGANFPTPPSTPKKNSY